jgi:5-hydroxyisourate hydrolase
MSGYLTTHVLDTANGCPAEGMKIELFYLDADTRTKLAEKVTNADGRTEGPILPAEGFRTGTFELVFHAGDYLRSRNAPSDFLDVVPLRFGMTEDDHYHVPLLLSPFSFSTYRGS